MLASLLNSATLYGLTYAGIGIEQLGIRDDPFCGCTIIDKDHEATITGEGMVDYFRLLHIEVIGQTFVFFFTALVPIIAYALLTCIGFSWKTKFVPL